MIRFHIQRRWEQRRHRTGWLAVLFASTVFLVLGSVPAVAAPNLYDITDPLSTATDPGSGGSEDLCALVAEPPGADLDASPLGVPGTPSGYDGRVRTYCDPAPQQGGSRSAAESAGPVPCIEVPVVDDRCEAWVGLYDPAPSVPSASGKAAKRWEYPFGGIALDEGNGRIYQTGVSARDRCASEPNSICPKFQTVAYDTDGNRVWAATYGGPSDDLAQPYDVEVSPDGERVYVTGLISVPGKRYDLVVLAYDARTGAQLWESIDDDLSRGSWGLSMALSPDGDEIYVTGFDWIEDPQPGCNCNDKNDFLVRAVDAATGAIGWEARYDGPRHDEELPKGVAVGPDGTTVYVTGWSVGEQSDLDYATVAYNAVPPQAPGDPELGAELWATRFDQGSDDTPMGGIVMSLDGSLVFVTGRSRFETDQIAPDFDWATVAYDAATGAQVWLQNHGPGGNMDRQSEPRGLALSPDGERLYVAGTTAPSLWEPGAKFGVAAYDAATGVQVWAEAFDPSSPHKGIGYLSTAYGVEVSPDGETVYVMGETGNPTGSRLDSSDHSARLTTVALSSSSGSRRWTAQYDPRSSARTSVLNGLTPNKHIVSDSSTVYVSGSVRNIEYVYPCCAALFGVDDGWDFALLAYDAGD